MGIEPTS